jgi:predicted nucleic acid-binding protein
VADEGVLVDANVILDVFGNDPTWADWSQGMLEQCAQEGPLFINPVIYAEVSIGFERIEEFETALGTAGFRMLAIPKEALFLAGKVFLRYRRQGGMKVAPLPDFFIGGHAVVADLPLLTRDAKRFRSYFPRIKLIAPRTQPSH